MIVCMIACSHYQVFLELLLEYVYFIYLLFDLLFENVIIYNSEAYRPYM